MTTAFISHHSKGSQPRNAQPNVNNLLECSFRGLSQPQRVTTRACHCAEPGWSPRGDRKLDDGDQNRNQQYDDGGREPLDGLAILGRVVVLKTQRSNHRDDL